MNRKHFLSSLAITSLGLSAFSHLPAPIAEDENFTILPPYLKPGDTIGITCPAGHITQEEIMPAIRTMQSWGFKIRVGSTVGKSDFSFGGTDAERLQDLQAMLDDPSIQAIMCARGGYGSARIIDQVNFNNFRQHPKWVIGFSDITVLHCHINRLFGIASLHSKMCNSFPDDFAKAESVVQETILSIQQALTGKPMQYLTPADPNNRTGTGKGVLIGGNLSMLASVLGTNSEINTIGKILFVEEVSEYLYTIDRYFNSLQRAHKLDNLAGLVIGGFNRLKPDDPGEEFGRTVFDIVKEKVKDFSFPVCFNFPVGHQKGNYALKCGVMHQLEVQNNRVSLKEIIS
ncbi:S66 peptidase family protein [Chitinophaga silvisoli]|uniref:LD-carboxypeptidase n=1 Tax=Chitinophaga silvisoli TaxID=2291814 RepID=A0A3E1P2I7_9BACT|nr:LD-carboxypeptidase [Chitinophaga silvisoli]RFM34188.1 LD-carboxypeptidase [Chitinophaga silvisoli]